MALRETERKRDIFDWCCHSQCLAVLLPTGPSRQPAPLLPPALCSCVVECERLRPPPHPVTTARPQGAPSPGLSRALRPKRSSSRSSRERLLTTFCCQEPSGDSGWLAASSRLPSLCEAGSTAFQEFPPAGEGPESVSDACNQISQRNILTYFETMFHFQILSVCV